MYSGEPFVEALKTQVYNALNGCLPIAQAYLATLKPFLEFLNVDVDLYMQHLAYVGCVCVCAQCAPALSLVLGGSAVEVYGVWWSGSFGEVCRVPCWRMGCGAWDCCDCGCGVCV